MLDITTLAAWGEFIGGIAVVVSLIYLAGQIRQNSKLVRASTTASTAQEISAFNRILIEAPEVSRIYWDGLAEPDSLSEADRRRFIPLISQQMQIFANQFDYARDDVGSRRMWQQQEQGLLWSLQQPGVLQRWGEWGGICGSELFREFVEGRIREGEAAVCERRATRCRSSALLYLSRLWPSQSL